MVKGKGTTINFIAQQEMAKLIEQQGQQISELTQAMQTMLRGQPLLDRNGEMVNGRRVLHPVAAKTKSAPVVVQQELKFVGLAEVEGGKKDYSDAVMLKFSNDARGRFIYREELEAVIAAVKAGLLG